MPLVLLLKGGGLNNKHDLKKNKKKHMNYYFYNKFLKNIFFLNLKQILKCKIHCCISCNTSNSTCTKTNYVIH